jgi:hypothetical protein
MPPNGVWIGTAKITMQGRPSMIRWDLRPALCA